MRLLITFIFSVFTLTAQATQLVEWANKPISVVLPVGKERIIQVPDHVYVGVPGSIKSMIRVQSAQGHVYLTALGEFMPSRVQLKLHESGKIILLDVRSSNESEETENIVISLPSKKRAPVQASTSNVVNVGTQPVTPIQLTRFAARMFYGPERLAISDNRIRVSKASNVDLSTLFTGKSFGKFEAKAQAVFRSGNMYLIAIKLRNKSNSVQTIEFKDLNVDFQYATPQHLQVNRANVPGDTTMLYLITNKPLEASLFVMPRIRRMGE